MPSWEETKRAGQAAFIRQGEGFSTIPESISDAYRQILSTGHIHPSMEDGSLTRQIAEENFEQPETQQPEIYRTIEQEQDIEPER